MSRQKGFQINLKLAFDIKLMLVVKVIMFIENKSVIYNIVESKGKEKTN